MYYKNWKDYIKSCKTPVEYDFKNQIEGWIEEHPRIAKEKKKLAQELIHEDNSIKKILLYKNKELKGFDCDSCTLINSIYEELWNCKEYSGETMNSFQTSANCATEEQGLDSIRKIEDLPNLKTKFEKYAVLTHTIGNFIPVPKGSFNRF